VEKGRIRSFHALGKKSPQSWAEKVERKTKKVSHLKRRQKKRIEPPVAPTTRSKNSWVEKAEVLRIQKKRYRLTGGEGQGGVVSERTRGEEKKKPEEKLTSVKSQRPAEKFQKQARLSSEYSIRPLNGQLNYQTPQWQKDGTNNNQHHIPMHFKSWEFRNPEGLGWGNQGQAKLQLWGGRRKLLGPEPALSQRRSRSIRHRKVSIRQKNGSGKRSVKKVCSRATQISLRWEETIGVGKGKGTRKTGRENNHIWGS